MTRLLQPARFKLEIPKPAPTPPAMRTRTSRPASPVAPTASPASENAALAYGGMTGIRSGLRAGCCRSTCWRALFSLALRDRDSGSSDDEPSLRHLSGHLSRSQPSARGVDVGARTVAPDGGVHPRADQQVTERPNLDRRGAANGVTRRRVQRDEVHVGAEGAGQGGQLAGVPADRIAVDPVDQEPTSERQAAASSAPRYSWQAATRAARASGG